MINDEESFAPDSLFKRSEFGFLDDDGFKDLDDLLVSDDDGIGTCLPISSVSEAAMVACIKHNDVCYDYSAPGLILKNHFLNVDVEPHRPMTRKISTTPQNNEKVPNFTSSEPALVSTPGPAANDIVCGRGRFMYNHPGSIRFRAIVQKAIPYYQAANTRSLKSIVINIILDQVFECGDAIRFLKFNSSSKTWTSLTGQQIRDKVGHALRDNVLLLESRRSGSR